MCPLVSAWIIVKHSNYNVHKCFSVTAEFAMWCNCVLLDVCTCCIITKNKLHVILFNTVAVILLVHVTHDY